MATVVSDIKVFDRTMQKTMRWIDAVAGIMGSTDRQRAFMVLRSVLHALRDRLPPNESVQLAAQLPMLVRGFYYEGWHPQDKPKRYRHKGPFLKEVADAVPTLDNTQVERGISAVFEVLAGELPGGELEHVRHALPAELRELWAVPGM